MGNSVLCRTRRHLTGAAAVLALAIAPASASAVTVGDSSQNPFNAGCSTPLGVGATSSDYTVPAGSWTVTSWSTRAHSDDATIRLRIYRPSGTPGEYTVVADSSEHPLPLVESPLQTYPTSIAVEGGDLLGFVLDGTASVECGTGTGDAADTFFLGGEANSPGDTIAPNHGSGIRPTVSAELVSAGPPPDLCFGQPATITGNGVVAGTEGDDVIITGNGNDVVDGKGGNDRICTRGGDDHARGGAGNDRLNSGNGNDNTGGQSGNDIVQSTGGDDDVQGGDGMDHVTGGEGDDTLNGGNDVDALEGQGGNDLLAGNAGSPDYCDGGDGTDKATTNGGCETIVGIP
jgi:Ca2+-binding RTX toxin-like protein